MPDFLSAERGADSKRILPIYVNFTTFQGIPAFFKTSQQKGQAARVFTEFLYQTVSGSWSRQRRVVAKAEYLDDKENPRFVVTSLESQSWPAQNLYEELYCARGDMENRIKEQFSLFASRVSAESFRANQLPYLLLRLGLCPAARATTLGTGRNRAGASANVAPCV
jgi:hypothetical protein